MLVCLILSQRSLRLSSALFILFTLLFRSYFHHFIFQLTDHGLVPLPCGSAREPKRPGLARTAHPPASRREDSSREGPVWQALSGHKRSNTLAVELPPQATGPGTLIPSVRRLVWAGKHQLGNAAWGASFPSERALPAGGFGSVHTPSP